MVLHKYRFNAPHAIFAFVVQAVGVPVSRRSGGRMATTSVATINDIILAQRHYFLNLFWHERAAFQLSVFGRATAGNDVVATKNYFLFSFHFSLSSTFLIEGVLVPKHLLSES